MFYNNYNWNIQEEVQHQLLWNINPSSNNTRGWPCHNPCWLMPDLPLHLYTYVPYLTTLCLMYVNMTYEIIQLTCSLTKLSWVIRRLDHFCTFKFFWGKRLIYFGFICRYMTRHDLQKEALGPGGCDSGCLIRIASLITYFPVKVLWTRYWTPNSTLTHCDVFV